MSNSSRMLLASLHFLSTSGCTTLSTRLWWITSSLSWSPSIHFLCHLNQKMTHCTLPHQQLCNWIPNSLLWRWRWNRSLGWHRSVTWILTRNTSRRHSKNWVIQRYPIRSCHPGRIPQRKSWRCQSTSNIRHPSWRTQQSRRCCTCRLNWGRRPKRNRRWCWMRLNRWSSLRYYTSKTFWSRMFTWGPNVMYLGWWIHLGWRHSCLKSSLQLFIHSPSQKFRRPHILSFIPFCCTQWW